MDYVEHDLKSLMQYGMKKPFMTGEKYFKFKFYFINNNVRHI